MVNGRVDYTNPITIGVILLSLGAVILLALVAMVGGIIWASLLLAILLLIAGGVAVGIGGMA